MDAAEEAEAQQHGVCALADGAVVGVARAADEVQVDQRRAGRPEPLEMPPQQLRDAEVRVQRHVDALGAGLRRAHLRREGLARAGHARREDGDAAGEARVEGGAERLEVRAGGLRDRDAVGGQLPRDVVLARLADEQQRRAVLIHMYVYMCTYVYICVYIYIMYIYIYNVYNLSLSIYNIYIYIGRSAAAPRRRSAARSSCINTNNNNL